MRNIMIRVKSKIKKIIYCIKSYIYDDRKTNSRYSIAYSYLEELDVGELSDDVVRYLYDRYINHEFDLLGSGWTKVSYKENYVGLEGYKYEKQLQINKFDNGGKWLKKIICYPHLKFSKKINKYIDHNYERIDWAIDFKSGYRFSQKVCSKYQPIGKLKGVDIKVPWELSRMNYILQLAVFAIKLQDDRETIIREFKNEILDFIATNPVNMGPNWACTMDVGIRISNILLAYDILKKIDKSNILDKNFCEILSSSVYQHGKFIINNLEWSPNNVPNNHYLSNIVGLLFVSSYLNRTEETDAWLVFSIQELIECFKNQFYSDGSNFEASTSYHRLSGELIIYSTALIYGILNKDKKEALGCYDYKKIVRLKKLKEQEYELNNKEFFPNWYVNKIKSMMDFTKDITKPNNNIVQIGDNDNGRFIKLSPCGNFISKEEAIDKYYNLKNYNSNMNLYFDENILNNRAFIASINAILENNNEELREYSLEMSFIKSLSNNKILIFNEGKKDIYIKKEFYKEFKYSNVNEFVFSDYGLKDINLSDLTTYYYDKFGIALIKSHEFFISIMVGDVGQNGNGGHAHCDKLSFELNINGIDVCKDSGTYLYTPFEKIRNEFRSVRAHNCPYIEGEEQGNLEKLFCLRTNYICEIIELSKTKIKAYFSYNNVEYFREICIVKDKVVINDFCNKKFKVNFNNKYSNGYGKLLNL